ncbi:MAG: YiiX/YebB-like N1pC/P60 family cysteine hydrolase [Candidatus Heimdallarchaeaceae archaeon]
MIGKLLFVKNNSLIGSWIRRVTNSEYNHVGIFVSKDNIIESRFVGVEETPFSRFKLLKEQKKLDYKIYRIKPEFQKYVDKIIFFVRMQLGKKYDFIQMLALYIFLLFRIKRTIEPIEYGERWLCSELIAEAFEYSGLKIYKEIDSDQITPGDLLRSDFIEEDI